jgi:hypothetical protein
MSYDLAFWKQKPTCTVQPSVIYHDLLDGVQVECLETIPTADFVARVQQTFPGIIEDGGLVFWDGGKQGFFELYSSDQHVHFCCRELSSDDMNTLIDIAVKFQCCLYDPQNDKRYDEHVV